MMKRILVLSAVCVMIQMAHAEVAVTGYEFAHGRAVVSGMAGFVAYSDFWFDRHIRDASRNYIRQIDGGARNTSWCFPVGVSVSCSF